MEYIFSPSCYAKMLMHPMKFCHATCNGLLLSSQDDIGEPIKFVDCIPLFHTGHTMTPNLEISIKLVSQYAKDRKLEVKGYYQANQNYDDNQPDVFSKRIAESIGGILCIINNKGFESMIPGALVDVYTLQADSKWKPKPPSSFTVEGNHETLNEKVLFSKERLYKSLVDFDDHLDDISLDWTNKGINQKLEDIFPQS